MMEYRGYLRGNTQILNVKYFWNRHSSFLISFQQTSASLSCMKMYRKDEYERTGICLYEAIIQGITYMFAGNVSVLLHSKN